MYAQSCSLDIIIERFLATALNEWNWWTKTYTKKSDIFSYSLLESINELPPVLWNNSTVKHMRILYLVTNLIFCKTECKSCRNLQKFHHQLVQPLKSRNFVPNLNYWSKRLNIQSVLEKLLEKNAQKIKYWQKLPG